MLDFLDMRTLLVNTLLICLLFGMLVIAYAIKHKNFKGIVDIGLGHLLIAMGSFLLSLRDYAPDYLSILLANLIFLYGLIRTHRGFAALKGITLQREKYFEMAMLATAAISCVYYTYANANVNMRIIVFSTLFSAELALIARTLLLTSTSHVVHVASRMLGASYILFSMFFLVRAATTLNEIPLANFLTAGSMHSSALLVIQLSILCSTFGVVWIATTFLEHDLRDQATHDPLTQVYNRRALNDIVSNEHSRSMRSEHPLSVIMVDIDQFKKLNDQHGHLAGDIVLKDFANVLCRNTRGHDTVARFGGEEFIVLLPDTDLEQVKLVAEKLRTEIANHESYLVDDQIISVTASFGITSSQAEDEPWQSILERADQALYAAKREGRNCVVTKRPSVISHPQDAKVSTQANV